MDNDQESIPRAKSKGELLVTLILTDWIVGAEAKPETINLIFIERVGIQDPNIHVPLF